MRFSKEKIRILVVDDSSEFRGLLKNHLRHLGIMQICEADSAKRVDEQIRREKPDVVFLDINMPGISGLDLLPVLKKDYPKLFIVIISGEGAPGVVENALRRGADGYVLKPFSSKIVSDMLDSYLGKKKKRELLNCYLLDDEPLALDILETELKKRDASVGKFSAAAQLFAAMTQKKPDIVFLDIQMPEIDGFDVLKQIKDQDPFQYVVMVSADSNIESVKRSIAMGAEGFLVKPFNPEKLQESLNNYRKKKKS